MWKSISRFMLGSREAGSDIPPEAYSELFNKEAVRFVVPLAAFIFLVASHRCYLMMEFVQWPGDWLPIVVMSAVGSAMLIIFIQLWRGKIAPRFGEITIFVMLLLASADIAVFSAFHPNTTNALEGAQFVTFCFAFIAVHYRFVVVIFFVVSSLTIFFSPPGYLHLEPTKLLTDGIATLLLVWLLLRVKSSGIRHLALAQWRALQKSAELTQTVQQLRVEVEERRRAEAERRKSEAQLRALSREVIEIQEKERAHLSRELHDELGQMLTAAHLSLDGIKRRVSPEIAGLIADTSQMIAESIDQIRDLATELRPRLLDQLGLEAAIQWSVDRFRNRSPFEWSFKATSGSLRFPIPVEAACFRIAQEAMTNAVRHARPQQVDVTCSTTENELTVAVQDDGVGFDTNRTTDDQPTLQGLGLVGMRERAESLGGHLEIRSQTGAGTRVEVTFHRPSAQSEEKPS
ncbi:sensor histidine kinase [bacterium]|nr:sensor histidine kinase [bacterium]